MSKNTFSTTKIILTHSENWKQWYEDLQANISSKIWSYINSEAQQQSLLQQSSCSELINFEDNVTTYVQLSVSHQQAYKNTRRFYKQDKKDYACQQDQFNTVRIYISVFIFCSKWIFLRVSQSVCWWLKNLKRDIKSFKSYMITQTKNWYNEMMRSFKLNKLS